MTSDIENPESEAEQSGSGIPQTKNDLETDLEKNKDSDANKVTDTSFSEALSPPKLTPMKGSDNFSNVQGPVSLVPNVNFNFNQFIANIPNFSGENPEISVSDFLDKIIEVRDFAGWQETQCVFAIKMKCIGEAQKFIKSQPHLKQTQSFKVLKEALTSRFSKTVDEAYHLQEFTMARQYPRESNRAFLSRVLGLSYKCFAEQETIREKLLVQKCLQGLQPEVRKFVMPHAPGTYKQIWDLAICHEKCTDYDQAQTQINVAQANNIASNELMEIKSLIQTVVSESDRKIAELSNQVQTLLQVTQAQGQGIHNFQQGPSNYRHNRPRRPVICYQCNQPGHIKRNCTSVSTRDTQNQGPLNQ